MLRPSLLPVGGRIVAGAFGLAFAGIGLAILGAMWGPIGPFGGEFGGPPLFFRIFASLIAIPFVAVGGTALFAAVAGASPISPIERLARAARRTEGRASYSCPHCGSPLSDGAEVSPHGDAKCAHCAAWFNVHGDGS
jgi:hypothetical protein